MSESSKLDDFLKPESMVTPGVLGAVAMAIANTLYVSFGLAQAISCLVLSFLIGAVVFQGASGSPIRKGVLYVINSLLIFVAAAGANATGTKLMNASAAQASAFEIVTTAYAAEGAAERVQTPTKNGNSPGATPQQSTTPAPQAVIDTKAAPAAGGQTPAPQERKFFSTW